MDEYQRKAWARTNNKALGEGMEAYLRGTESFEDALVRVIEGQQTNFYLQADEDFRDTFDSVLEQVADRSTGTQEQLKEILEFALNESDLEELHEQLPAWELNGKAASILEELVDGMVEMTGEQLVEAAREACGAYSLAKKSAESATGKK